MERVAVSPGEPLVLSVPPRLDARGVEALATGLEAAAAASVVVLEGAPGRFCLGMDFVEVTTGDVRAKLAYFSQVVAALARCPRPTLAIVDGPALGGGLGLAAICDYVLASERAELGLPEARYGLAPSIIRPALLTRISPQQLRMLVLTGYARSAATSATLGLCDEVVASAGLAVARSRAIRQLARARSTSVGILRRWSEAELARLLAAGVDETAAALESAAVRAALHDEEGPWLP